MVGYPITLALMAVVLVWAVANLIGLGQASDAILRENYKSILAAFLLGLIFGIALGPCTFAYMAPILAVAFKMSGTSLLCGALLLLVYGAGHCSVIVAAGTSTEMVQHYLNWNERSKGTLVIKDVCGVLVLLGGRYLIYVAP